MKLANLIALGIAAMSICLASHAESPKRPQKTVPPRPIELQQNVPKENLTEIIDQHNVVTAKLLTTAKFCQTKYFEEFDSIKSEIALQRSRNAIYKAGRDLVVENAETPSKIMKIHADAGFEYMRCAESSKLKMKPVLIEYIGLFKTTERLAGAKQIYAQWLTAVDAVGEVTFDGEFSKLNNLINSMTVELNI